MRDPASRLLALVLALAGTGCATIGQARSPEGPAAFGGVRRALSKLRGSVSSDFNSCGPPPLLYWIVLPLDLPFSFAADTLLLPASIPNEIGQGGIVAGQR